MDKIEASGRTLEEALQTAAQQLRVSVDAVEYEIVEEGAKGFLGLGQTPTLVKAWVGERTEPAAPKTWEAPAEVEEEVIEEEVVGGVSDADIPVVAGVSAAEPPLAQSEDEFVDAVMASLTSILGPMGVDARPVLRSVDQEEIVVDIVGPDVAILIGRHAQTLDALQYLIGLIAGKRFPTRRRVILDAESYRERHQEMLENKAHDYAKAVKEEGKEAVLEPQNARDRRIIHVALAEDPDVYTYSEGEGEDRHVVISPKK